MSLAQLLGKLNHHAYALVGGTSVRLELISFLKGEHSVVVRGNPDFFVRKYEVLTIDDARTLKEMHAMRPFSGGNEKNATGHTSSQKFFIIEIDSITHEAQNALLKIFEEPNEYAHFFLVISSTELLLPTLRSRLFIIRTREAHGQEPKENPYNPKDFLALSPAERVTFVDKLAADISDGKRSKSDALDFCAELSKQLYVGDVEKNAATLAAIAQTESYLRDRAPSIKQLLEYVALSI